MAAIKDYYKILGVDEQATKADIKKSYRKLAREYHPDSSKDKSGTDEKFKEIQEAYEVLSDAEKRRKYDRFRKNPFAGAFGGQTGDSGQPFGGDPFADMFTSRGGGRFYRAPDGTYVRMDRGESMRGGPQPENPFGGLGDMFSQFFRGGSTAEEPAPASSSYDRRRTVRISFKRMLEGGKVRIELDGRKIQVPFPKGVRDGYRLRVRGTGVRGPGGRTGDLYVTFRVKDHADIVREGNDLHAKLTISAMEAILGAEKTVQNVYGKKIKLRIRAGIQPGEVLRVKGHGIETDRETGNLLVHVHVVIPDGLTDSQRSVLERAAREAGLQ